MGKRGRWIEGGGKRECFRVNVDKWVRRLGEGSGEHRQLGQGSRRGTGKWGFYLRKHLRETHREQSQTKAPEMRRFGHSRR